MNVIRKILLFLFVFFFSGLLLLNSAVWTARLTVLDREVIKSWLTESKVYDNFVEQLAKIANESLSKESDGDADEHVDFAALTEAGQAAFTPLILQKNAEKVLDGTYDWLEGKTSSLSFNLDLSEQKQKFVDQLADNQLEKMASLPTCSQPVGDDFDPFSATCLPSGLNINAEVEQMKDQLLNSEGFLPDTTISASDVKIGSKTIDKNFSSFPKYYGWLKSSPIILAVLTVLDSAIIVLLSRPMRKGFKTLVRLFAVSGVVLLIFGGSLLLLRGWASRSLINNSEDTGLAETIISPLAKQVAGSVGKWDLVFGSTYVGAAMVALATYMIIKKSNPRLSDEATEHSSEKSAQSVAKPENTEETNK